MNKGCNYVSTMNVSWAQCPPPIVWTQYKWPRLVLVLKAGYTYYMTKTCTQWHWSTSAVTVSPFIRAPNILLGHNIMHFFFTFMWPCIVTNFLIIKQTRCTNFSNLFLEWNSTCFGQFLCPSSGIGPCTQSNGICHTGLPTAARSCQKTWFFLSCKANATVKPAKTGHGPHSS